MPPGQRQMNGGPVSLYKRILKRLGRDTSFADAEIELMRQRLATPIEGGMLRSELTSQPVIRPASVHSDPTDDCRDPYYNGGEWCPSNGGGWCWYTYVENLGEILFNEARAEAAGAQAMVAWTVRDRVLETLADRQPPCGHYIGGLDYNNTVRDSLPCTLPSGQSCSIARGYCYASHGGTTSVGASQIQFNDGHVYYQDVGAAYTGNRALAVINGWMWDRSGDPTGIGFIPPGVSNCAGDGCDYNFCYVGSNSWSGSPQGPMEYLNYPYIATQNGPNCKQVSGPVCGNGANPGDNYFWNRYP
jgi:hypothetical protein